MPRRAVPRSCGVSGATQRALAWRPAGEAWHVLQSPRLGLRGRVLGAVRQAYAGTPEAQASICPWGMELLSVLSTPFARTFHPSETPSCFLGLCPVCPPEPVFAGFQFGGSIKINVDTLCYKLVTNLPEF